MKTGLQRKPYQRLNAAKKRQFLRELEKSGNIKATAAMLNVTVPTIYNAISKDELFAAAIEIAKEKSNHTIETELRRRAIEGVTEDVYFKGDVVGQKTTYSDRLLELLAKGNIDKYGSLEKNNGIEININTDSVKTKLIDALGIKEIPPA